MSMLSSYKLLNAEIVALGTNLSIALWHRCTFFSNRLWIAFLFSNHKRQAEDM